jgi:hypothetical protein
MARISLDNVFGVYVDGKLFCMECFDGNLRQVEGKDIITEKDVEDSDDLFICDVCGKTL